MAQKPESVDRVDPRDLAIRLATVVCLIVGVFAALLLV
jgi:hypothetical protein